CGGAHLRSHGVTVIELDALTPCNVMLHLHKRNCLSVLWECGGTLAAQAISQGMVQKVWAFIAPKIIGGQLAPSPVGEMGFTKMTEALQLYALSWQSIGPDLLLTGYLSTDYNDT
ncbi:MAG: dihydrofolate reductase family protein, partial [Cyanobacteria bacterium J06626_14]